MIQKIAEDLRRDILYDYSRIPELSEGFDPIGKAPFMSNGAGDGMMQTGLILYSSARSEGVKGAFGVFAREELAAR